MTIGHDNDITRAINNLSVREQRALYMFRLVLSRQSDLKSGIDLEIDVMEYANIFKFETEHENFESGLEQAKEDLEASFKQLNYVCFSDHNRGTKCCWLQALTADFSKGKFVVVLGSYLHEMMVYSLKTHIVETTTNYFDELVINYLMD